MSKQDNLTDFLTDVADAIREKKGTTEKINPQKFSEEIRGIESGVRGEYNFDAVCVRDDIFAANNYAELVIHDGVTQISCYDFINLEKISLPSSLTILLSSCFQGCRKLTYVQLPEGLKTIGSNAFHLCLLLAEITIPSTLNALGSPCFGSCEKLASLSVASGNLTFDSRENCNAIIRTATNELVEGCITSVIPSGVVSIGTYAFRGRGPATLAFPASITSIQANAFNSNTQTSVYDFRAATSVPILASTNAFSAALSSSKIVVPDNLYDQWKSATNWSTYASRIVKASEFVEPTNE
jgi:hypothetical protein